jgi:hypothetical protein
MEEKRAANFHRESFEPQEPRNDFHHTNSRNRGKIARFVAKNSIKNPFQFKARKKLEPKLFLLRSVAPHEDQNSDLSLSRQHNNKNRSNRFTPEI